MKNLLFLLSVFTLSVVSYSQTDANFLMAEKQKVKTDKSQLVKLRNISFRQYELSVPGVIALSSVRLGSNSFCLGQGQSIYFTNKGQPILLYTFADNSGKKVSYNLSRLIRKRKRELGIK